MTFSAETKRLKFAMRDAIDRSSIPSLSVCIRQANDEIFHHTIGRARLNPEQSATPDQPYDLASLTKVLVGSTVTASLLHEGALALVQPVQTILPEVDPRIQIRHLLNHSAGFPVKNHLHHKFPPETWPSETTRAQLLRAACTTALVAPPGRQHAYTDVGFLVLLNCLETVGQARIDTLFQQRFLDKLPPIDLRWGWPNAAATVVCPRRKRLLEGEVHDLNCAALNGVSNHAGLFGTARSVATFAEFLTKAAAAPHQSTLPGTALRTLWNTTGPGTHCGGWDTISKPGYTSTGRFFPEDTIGHLGYTGTSLWMSPKQKTVVVLLTNRIHPNDDLSDIRRIRPVLHDAVSQFLGWSRVNT